MDQTFFNRQTYVALIIPFINKEIIKILVGQRRVGKSYMLFQLMDHIRVHVKNSKIIYINKELTKFSFIKTGFDLVKYIETITEHTEFYYLFIDEVQEIVNFQEGLRSLLAENRFDIYCTGSNANMLSSDIATHLAGRYIQFQINSLSYTEFLEFHHLEDSSEACINFMKFGGLPYLHHLELKDHIVFEYLKSIYNTILLKDVISRHNIRNISFLERLNLFLANNLGSILSAKRISDFLKSQKINSSPKVILDYLKFLEDAFFIRRVRRYDINGRRIFELNDKFYFTDLGLRNTLQPFNTKDINKLLENVVYNALIIEGFEVYVGKLDELEIDFVALKQDQVLYIQVAYIISDQKVHEREFGNLLKIDDNHRKLVISMDEVTTNYKGIEHHSLRSFLLNPGLDR